MASLSKDQCISRDNNDTDTSTSYYYCPNKGVCERLIAYQDADRVSSNFCGIDPLTNQLIYPYLTSEECTNGISQCSKYANLSVNEKKSKCLADTNCGWCTNSQGIGDCIEGTASGPINLYKYNFCLNDSISDNNKYTYTNISSDIMNDDVILILIHRNIILKQNYSKYFLQKHYLQKHFLQSPNIPI